MRRTIPVVDRLLAKTKRAASGCLLWTGAIHKRSGYGLIGLGRKEDGVGYVHRVLYEARHGALPRHLDVCHSCDVRNCVEDSHLFAGTRTDNMRDCLSKKRHWKFTKPETAQKIWPARRKRSEEREVNQRRSE